MIRRLALAALLVAPLALGCEDKPDLSAKPLEKGPALPAGKDPLESFFGEWQGDAVEGAGVPQFLTAGLARNISVSIGRGTFRIAGAGEVNPKSQAETAVANMQKAPAFQNMTSRYALVGLDGDKTSVRLDNGEIVKLELRGDGRLAVTDAKRNYTVLFTHGLAK